MKKSNKAKQQPELDEQGYMDPIWEDDLSQDPENLFNLGPTGHGPDICYSDADPGL